MIEETALAHVIAPEKQRPRASVPDREREIAEQMRDAVLAPMPVGGEQHRAVRHVGQLRGGDAELVGKLLAIVEPKIGDRDQVGGGVAERLRIEQILTVHAQQAVRHADSIRDRGPAAVGSAMRQDARHALDRARRDVSAVEPDDAGDRAHPPFGAGSRSIARCLASSSRKRSTSARHAAGEISNSATSRPQI